MGRSGGSADQPSDGWRGPARFEAMVEHSRDLVAVADGSGRYLYVNPAHTRVLGWLPEELLGRQAIELIHPDDLARVQKEFAEQVASTAEPTPVEFRYRHRDGGWRWLDAAATNLLEHPAVSGVVVDARDITERRRAFARFADEAQILESVARGAPLQTVLVAIAAMVERWIEDATAVVLLQDGPRMRVGAAPHLPDECVAALDGLKLPAVDGPRFLATDLHAYENKSMGVAERFQELGYRACWAARISCSEGVPLGSVVVYRPAPGDPSPVDRQLLELVANVAGICVERGHAEERMRKLALSDFLTGLANRGALFDRLRQIVPAAPSTREIAAVLFLDLDRFKDLNDSVGHAVGDQLLAELGPRLLNGVRAGDLVARVGGDEFVVVCEDLEDVDEARVLAERLLELVEEPFVIDGRRFVTSASIGIALVEGNDGDAALRDADAAMYHAKERGRRRVEVFDDELRSTLGR